MPFDSLNRHLPTLQNTLAEFPAVNYLGPLWDLLYRLLVAHAPSGGANLLGGIGDDIALLADGLGLHERVLPHISSATNTAIWLGADKPAPDVVVVAHMDRLSFRVRSLETQTLYSISPNRFPPGEYRITAKAVHFEQGRLVVGAEGVLISTRDGERESLRMDVKQGQLSWLDTVLLDVIPARDGDLAVGTGLDNGLGVLTTLLTAAALHSIEAALREANRRCVFVFTDHAEGYLGHGAARLAHTLPPPTCGCVLVDAHTVGYPFGSELGSGISHAVTAAEGRGSIVPPNYHALAVDLARAINDDRPGTVQINNGYLPHGDDKILSQWTRILGLAGPPMAHPHTGQETAHLGDIQSGVWWLSYFLAAVLNLAPGLTPLYSLGC